MNDTEQQDERAESYTFRQFILRSSIAYSLAATPPVAKIFKDSRSLEDRDNGPCDWELEISRVAQLRRGIDIKHIVRRFVEGLARDHGEKRAQQFTAWVLGGYINRVSHAKRGEIYADRSDLIDAIKAGGYRRGNWD